MDIPTCNVAVVGGILSSDPIPRDLPSGDTVLTYEVTVRGDGRPTSTVPVAWFGAPSKAPVLARGDAVLVTGRVHRRFFRVGGQTQSRTELVADEVVPVRRRAAVTKALDRALAQLLVD